MIWYSHNRMMKSSTRSIWITLLYLQSRSFPSHALNICIISGSTRILGPPQPILSDRVTTFITKCLQQREQNHRVTTIRAREKDLPLMEKPHFGYSKSDVPKQMEDISRKIQEADAYIVITPEYNHSPCPGLMNIMNHFGSSYFGFKPSGIVSYSAGQWGGTRAAHSLRPFLSELGCLPVSAMVHIPSAADVLRPNGVVIQDEESWNRYLDRMFAQLEWWATAAKNHKQVDDPYGKSPPFKIISERNSPTNQ